MKKLLALLLALTMVFALFACTDGSTQDGDDEEEEKEESYPQSYTFAVDGFEWTLELVDSKNVEITHVAETMDEEELWMVFDVDVEDAEFTTYYRISGTYRFRNGTYTLTLKSICASATVTGADRQEVIDGILEYFEGDDAYEDYVQIFNGEEVDITEEWGWENTVMKVEIEDGQVVAMASYEEDGTTISTSYTFYSDGNMKTHTEYWMGQIEAAYTYYKDGTLQEVKYYTDGALYVTYKYDTDGSMTDVIYEDEDWDATVTPGTAYSQGWETTMYADGSCVFSEAYYENGVMLYYCEYYYGGGTEVEYWYNEDGWCYQYCAYYESGVMCYEVTYESQDHGSYYSWAYYENGNTEYFEYWEDFYLSYGDYYTEDGEWYMYYTSEEGYVGVDEDDEMYIEGPGYVKNDEYTTFWGIEDLLLWDDEYYTLEGYPAYIAVSAPLDWYLDGSSLMDVVNVWGEYYFDLSDWDALLAETNEDGYARLTPDTYQYLLTTITGNPNWMEDESYAYLYMAYWFE